MRRSPISTPASSPGTSGRDTRNHALQPGCKLLWYRVKSISAWREFSIEYLCEDLNLGRQVILLEYFPHQLAQRKKDQKLYPIAEALFEDFNQRLERFVSAAEDLTKINHRQIEKIFDVFEANSTAYAVLPYRERQNLDGILARDKTLTEIQLLRILFPLLDGMEKLFEYGPYQLGLTPASILIGNDGEPRLDTAHVLNQAAASHGDDLQIKTEIYRLGAILYRAVTGAFPPEEQQRLESHSQHHDDPYLPIAQQAISGYSQKLLNAIDFALRLDAKERPASIAEWRQSFDFREYWSIVEFFNELTEAPETYSKPGLELSHRHSEVEHREAAENGVDDQLHEICTGETMSGPRGKIPWYALGRRLALTLVVIFACVGFYEVSISVTSLFQADGTASPPADQTYVETFLAVTPPPQLPAPSELQPPLDKPGEPSQGTASVAPESSVDGPDTALDQNTPGSPAQQEQTRINSLLAEANDALTAGRLTYPEDDNAVEKYRAVLALVSDHPEATHGIARVVDALVQLAQAAAQEGEWDQAETHLAKAASIDPESPRLAEAWRELDTQRANAQKQVQLAKQEVQRKQVERKANEMIDLARRALDRGELEEAKSYAAQATEISPKLESVEQIREELKQRQNDVTPPATTAEGERSEKKAKNESIKRFVDRALNAMEGKDWDIAQSYLDQAAKLSPKNDDVRLVRDQLASRKRQAQIESRALVNTPAKEQGPGTTAERKRGTGTHVLVQIQRASSSLTKARPGDTVGLLTEYAMSTPAGQKYEYVEVSWILKRNGKKLGQEGMTAGIKESGVNSASNHISLSDRVTPGRYVVEHRVRAGDSVDTATTEFLVMAN